MKNLFYYFFIFFLISSCNKEKINIYGNLELKIYPLISDKNIESEYGYLYIYEGYSTSSIPLYRLSVREAKNNKNASVIVSIRDLNPGNYIFKYYSINGIVEQPVQVVSGMTKKYDL